MIPLAGVWPRVFAVGAVVLGLFFAGWSIRGRIAAADISKLKAEHAEVVAASEKAAREATEKVRGLEARINKDLEDAVNVARELERQRDAALSAADAARGGMLDAARGALRRCGAAPAAAAASGSVASGVPAGMSDADRLMLVLGRIDSRAGVFALDSERARSALDVCRRAYESARQEVKP